MKTEEGMSKGAGTHRSWEVGDLPIGCSLGRGWGRVSERQWPPGTESSPPVVGYYTSLGLNPGSTILGKSPPFAEPYFSQLQYGHVNTFVIILGGTCSECMCVLPDGTQEGFGTGPSPSLPDPRHLLFTPGSWLFCVAHSLFGKANRKG